MKNIDLKELKGLQEKLTALPYEGSRRALASLAMAFFGVVYTLVTLSAPPGWGPAFAGLALCYHVGFWGVAAGCFWGRWFATGLGYSGLMVGLFAMVNVGLAPPLVVYTLLHGLAVAALWGPKMAALYEKRSGWRERWGLDDFGVSRLGKTVTRAAGSLPALIVWALQPRDGQGHAWLSAASGVVLFLAVAGVLWVVRLRTLGVLALAGAAVLALFVPSLGAALGAHTHTGALPLLAAFSGSLGVAFLATALTPVAAPIWRHLRGRS